MPLTAIFRPKFQTCHWLTQQGEFRRDQSSKPIKDLEPILYALALTKDRKVNDVPDVMSVIAGTTKSLDL